MTTPESATVNTDEYFYLFLVGTYDPNGALWSAREVEEYLAWWDDEQPITELDAEDGTPKKLLRAESVEFRAGNIWVFDELVAESVEVYACDECGACGCEADEAPIGGYERVPGHPVPTVTRLDDARVCAECLAPTLIDGAVVFGSTCLPAARHVHGLIGGVLLHTGVPSPCQCYQMPGTPWQCHARCDRDHYTVYEDGARAAELRSADQLSAMAPSYDETRQVKGGTP